jgi:hypothetical protein
MPWAALSNWESGRWFGGCGDTLACVREQPHRGKHRTEVTEEELVRGFERTELFPEVLPRRKLPAILFFRRFVLPRKLWRPRWQFQRPT